MLNKLIHYVYFIFAYFLLKSNLSVENKNNPNIIFINNASSLNIPKIIWIFWYDLEIPELVDFCVKNIQELHPEYQINILNKENISRYLDLDVVGLIEKMPVANLSDLIRLKLLQKYGGVWMDASIILEDNIERFFLVENNVFDIIGFYNAYQSKDCELPVLESWFLAAPPNSKFINKWLDYFEQISELGSKGLFEKYKEYPNFDELCKGLGDPLYLIVYIAEKLAYAEMKEECNMLFYCCDDSAFSVQIYSQWRTRKCTSNLFICDKFIFSPIYKLTSGDRKYYSFLKRNKLINPKSIVGVFLERMEK